MPTTTTTNYPWPEQQPYLQYGYQQAQQNYQAPQQYYPGRTYVPFSSQSENYINQAGNLAQNNPLTNTMGGFLTNTLQGGYLPGQAGGNPYLDAMTQHLAKGWQEATMPALHSVFSKAGRGGADTHALAAGQAAGEFGGQLANMYGKMWDSERGRQIQAAGLMPQAHTMQWGDLGQLKGVGGMVEDKAGQIQRDAIDRWNFEQEERDKALQHYMNMIRGGGENRFGVQTQNEPTDWITAGGGLIDIIDSLFGSGGIFS